MDNDTVLHCLREISMLLLNIDESHHIKTRDKIQYECNKIWAEVGRGGDGDTE